jgi:hypothetical protein
MFHIYHRGLIDGFFLHSKCKSAQALIIQDAKFQNGRNVCYSARLYATDPAVKETGNSTFN